MEDQLDQLVGKDGCPKCGSENITPVKYTWWGGVLGPKILHHTKCNACKFLYNSKTRKSNTTGIIVYSVILFVIAFVVFFLLRTSFSF
ncbi:hypothetical protein [Ferruginibacter sp. HRS2-29]|uniref:hypothetical protein n=1 Tax=Ferruginibacter sp. HRS2-29 TaxID=2487334 RepID=UPI0020CDFAA3|nr:hypothetical protein [Ferruginibacter sp. HRS2-29]